MNLTRLSTRWIITNYLQALLLFTFFSAACHQSAADKRQNAVPPAAGNKMYVAVRTFKTGNGWGYSVYADGKLYIQQPFIPGIAGTHGFASKEDAQKAGKLILKKVSLQQRFPVVSKQELQNLGIALP